MKYLFILVILITAHPGITQSNGLLHKPWTAQWIGPAENTKSYGVYHYRKTITLPAKPEHYVVHISADNRCKLWVNGKLCFIGPTRGDTQHWNFESIDLAPYLLSGENTIAALVWNYGDHRPLLQISIRTGLIIQGDGEAEKEINTNMSWKSFHNQGYKPLKPALPYIYYASSPGDQVDFNESLSGWELSSFDDSEWRPATEIGSGLPKGVFAWSFSWMLIPSTLPQMERTSQRFLSVRETSGLTTPKEFPTSKKNFSIPANTTATLLLDQGHLTNAYPVIDFSGGKNARIHIHYAEALFIKQHDSIDWRSQRSKGNRNEVAGKRFVGVADEVISNGTTQQFIPLDWRTFRYVKLTITTKEEPLIMEDVYSIFTAYPFQLNASFTASDPVLTNIFSIGWRTARLCAEETYMDTPLYERLQYYGDTRIQALVSLFNSGDDRLMRQAIRLGDQSRISEGITRSRYPSHEDQFIPPFSLWWIGMVHDYYMYRNDTTFVLEMLPGIRQVLTFFQRYQQPDGRLKQVPYWLFTDWVSINGWGRGMPPIGTDGCSAVLDLQLLWAYQLAAQIENDLGMKDYATLYEYQSGRLKQAIQKEYWNEQRNLYSDIADKTYYSQHTNALAILTKLVPAEKAQQLSTKLLQDKTLTLATIYFLYYVNQALAKAGAGDQYINQLDIWKESIAHGLTTWPEISDINNTRSDCHAWGASPNIEFLRIVLGIDTETPGFKSICIKPHLGNLKSAEGSMPHANGKITAAYLKNKKGEYQSTIQLPIGTSGKLIWKEKVYELKAGVNEILLPN